ncbi:LysM peptidoglycan-binding domain-containing protein [Akkermansiaceae bacterium]|nr:LysM peptidoglycan-binding domain-containing protein [Akkermansiaceae bacterium]
MNKPIQIKRNKPASSHYRVLYAKTGRKRRLHAATTATADQHAGMGADAPSIGVGRALFVILILHVLAVAAIYIHSIISADANETTANEGQRALSEPPAALVVPVAPVAKKVVVKKKAAAKRVAQQSAHTGRHIVVTGDTYPRIARRCNVSETALRALNGGQALRAGIVLDLPAELSARPVDPKKSAPKASVAKKKESAIAAKAPDAKPAQAVKVTPAYDVSNAPKALVEEPDAPAAAPAIQDSGKTYTIKRGDTLWGISSRFKVSRDHLLALNGIKDANKLYAGRNIKIPAN